jgi:hypothetical protein
LPRALEALPRAWALGKAAGSGCEWPPGSGCQDPSVAGFGITAADGDNSGWGLLEAWHSVG